MHVNIGQYNIDIFQVQVGQYFERFHIILSGSPLLYHNCSVQGCAGDDGNFSNSFNQVA